MRKWLLPVVAFVVVGTIVFPGFLLGNYLASTGTAQPNDRVDSMSSDIADDSIQVVSTWKELTEQTPIEQDGFQAWIGIDATSIPVNRGVLIYCLTDGFLDPGKSNSCEQIGPFVLEVTHESDAGKKRFNSLSKIAFGQFPENIADSRALFLKSIPLANSGNVRIRVLTMGGELVGQVDVTVTDSPFHSWIPLSRSKNRVAELQEADGDVDSIAFVGNDSTSIVMPEFCGGYPFELRDRTDERARDLPGLIPVREKHGLRIKVDGTDLIVESREPIVHSSPENHFIARWWVNGRPFRPEAEERREERIDGGGMFHSGKKIRLRLDFDPEPWGIQPGDRVELRLLYCRSGWCRVQPQGKDLLKAMSCGDGPGMLLSDKVRIEWE